MADDYTAVAGKYKAMRWTGDNTAVFKAWVQSFTSVHEFTASDWTVQPGAYNGTDLLILSWTPDTYRFLKMYVPMGGWAIFGPYYGTDPTLYWGFNFGQTWNFLTDVEFQREYGAAV